MEFGGWRSGGGCHLKVDPVCGLVFGWRDVAAGRVERSTTPSWSLGPGLRSRSAPDTRPAAGDAGQGRPVGVPRSGPDALPGRCRGAVRPGAGATGATGAAGEPSQPGARRGARKPVLRVGGDAHGLPRLGHQAAHRGGCRLCRHARCAAQGTAPAGGHGRRPNLGLRPSSCSHASARRRNAGSTRSAGRFANRADSVTWSSRPASRRACTNS